MKEEIEKILLDYFIKRLEWEKQSRKENPTIPYHYDSLHLDEAVNAIMELVEKKIKEAAQNGADQVAFYDESQFKRLEAKHQQQIKELKEWIIELSDDIEAEGETTYEEWRAFKGFRNRLRDKLNEIYREIDT